MIMATRLEKYASGKWFVYTAGDYPKLVGHIVGGNKVYLAERGPESLGYFPTIKAAKAAIGADDPIPGDTAKGRRACERSGGHEWHEFYTDAGCGRCGASDEYR